MRKVLLLQLNYSNSHLLKNYLFQKIIFQFTSFIKKYIADGNIVINENATPITQESTAAHEVELDEVSQLIISILDEYVKPAVASDGGNIMFDSYDEKNKTVNVILQGACSGCPSSTMTLKSGIENMLKEMIPNKIDQVIAING